MTQPLRIGLIIGTTREGRFADKPASWLLDIAQKRLDDVQGFASDQALRAAAGTYLLDRREPRELPELAGFGRVKIQFREL